VRVRQDPVITQTSCIIKAVKEVKDQHDKKNHRHLECCCCHCWVVRQRKPWGQSTPRKALAKSLVSVKPKRSKLSFQDWILYKTPNPHRYRVQHFKLHWIRRDDLPPILVARYRPSGLFFSFWGQAIVGWPLAVQEEVQDGCDGVIQTITKDKFADAFWQGMDCREKYVQIGCDKPWKSAEIMEFFKWFVLKLHLFLITL
jgi:hypothetical protein